ncbi:DoxX family protein [Streptomyces sp. HMX87]|uniref:DoxX family protein n=1 Tax=Streptomyces sp. HMX87 TaxID=3390849 RepID=UPI003A898A66
MSPLRLVGRPLLASMFVTGGLNSVRNPESVAPVAEPVVRPIAENVPQLPDRTEQLVRLSGAVQVAGGILLGLGRFPRLSALAIAGTLVPTTLAAHRFWEAEDPSERSRQQIHFFKNLSMLGGLLIAADDTGSAPSLLWRGRHAAHDLRRDAHLVRRSVRATTRPASAAAGLRTKAGGLRTKLHR